MDKNEDKAYRERIKKLKQELKYGSYMCWGLPIVTVILITMKNCNLF